MALQFLAVGTGRDGTVSLTQILNDIFRLNGIRAEAAHEYLARDCYNAYCQFKETGDSEPLARLREQIRNCPYQAIVGNGYASILPLFRELFPNVALIHVQRRDREATIRSHHKNSLMFPETYVNYGPAVGTMRRVAAFHEGEMTRDAWNALGIPERFGWFYDYTHRTIAQEAARFPRHIAVETEALSEAETLERLARFVLQGPGKAPLPVHLNRHVYLGVDDFREAHRSYAQWLFGNVSAAAIESDPLYLADYLTNKFIALAGYQISGFVKEFAPPYARELPDILDSLNRFEALLCERYEEMRQLRNEVLERLQIRGTIADSAAA